MPNLTSEPFKKRACFCCQHKSPRDSKCESLWAGGERSMAGSGTTCLQWVWFEEAKGEEKVGVSQDNSTKKEGTVPRKRESLGRVNKVKCIYQHLIRCWK